MHELEIRFVDGGELNFNQSFLQFNVKKKHRRRVLFCSALTLLGPQAPCNIFIFFSVFFVLEINYEKL